MVGFDREALVRNLAIGIAMLLVAFFTGWDLFNLLLVYWLEITLVLLAGTAFALFVYIRAMLEKTTEAELKSPKHGKLEYFLAFVLAAMMGYFMFLLISMCASLAYHMILSITNQPALPLDAETNGLERLPWVVFGYAAKNMDLPSVVFAVLLLADFFAGKSMQKMPKWDGGAPETLDAKSDRVFALLAKTWLPVLERCLAFLAIVWLSTTIPSAPGIGIMFVLVAFKSLADSIGDDEPALMIFGRWLARSILNFVKKKA